MENASHLTEEAFHASGSATKVSLPAKSSPRSILQALSSSQVRPLAYSFTDHALAVTGSFLVNVVLARTTTKAEYGTFALCYSVYVFLTGLHNATILEPYTVYGSGRYRKYFSEYLRLMVRCNTVVGLFLTAILLLAFLVLWVFAPQWTSRGLLGLALAVGFLLTGIFLRRVFYVQQQPGFAAAVSSIFFLTVAGALWLTVRTHLLDSFSAFMILAVGWTVAAAVLAGKLQFGKPAQGFLMLEPGYWRQHWHYTRWVVATAFVFQFATQGYYWLLAGFLSVREVGELRAIYLIVSPVEQAFVAISFVVLPALASHYAAGKMQDFLSLWKRYALVTIGMALSFAVAVRLVGRPVLHVLYAGKFDDLTPLLYVLAFSPVFTGLGGSMVNALNAVEKPKFAFYGFLGSAVMTFLGGIPLVIGWGLRGAAYGVLLSGAMFCVALAIGFTRQVHSLSRLQTASVADTAISRMLP